MRNYKGLVNRQMLRDKKKTGLILVGIMISIVLLTFMIIFSQYMKLRNIEFAKVRDGDWTVGVNLGTDYKSKIDLLKNNALVKNFTLIDRQDGIIDLNNKSTELYIYGLDSFGINNIFKKALENDNAYKNFPKTDSEILLDKRMEGLGIKTKDKLTLGDKTYTVIGFFDYNEKNPSRNIIGLTKSDFNSPNNSDMSVCMNIKGSSNFLENMDSVLAKIGINPKKDGAHINYNREIMNYKYNVDPYSQEIYINFLDLLAIIFTIFLSVIINYGLISFMLFDKTKTISMLRCIGATPKQIRTLIYKEVLLISGISLIPSIIIGYGLVYMCISTLVRLYNFNTYGVVLLIYPRQIIIILIIAIVSIVLGAIRPVIHASKMSPIEGVSKRGMLKVKKVSSKFIKKIFGIEGELAYKNLRVNKLIFAISTILFSVCFIGFSLFGMYIVGIANMDRGKNLEVKIGLWTNSKQSNLYLKGITEKNLVEKYLKDKGLNLSVATVMNVGNNIEMLVTSKHNLNPKFKEDVKSLNDGKNIIVQGNIVIYNDAAFNMISNDIVGSKDINEFNNNGVIVVDSKKENLDTGLFRMESYGVSGQITPVYDNLKINDNLEINFIKDTTNNEETLKEEYSKKNNHDSFNLRVMGTISPDVLINRNYIQDDSLTLIVSESFIKNKVKNFSEYFSNSQSEQLPQDLIFNFKTKTQRNKYINDIINELPILYNVSIEDKYHEFLVDKNLTNMIITSVYTILMILLVLIFIIIIISKNLNASVRKKDFGTLLAIGMSKKSLNKSLILEAIIQFIIVMAISIPICIGAELILYNWMFKDYIKVTVINEIIIILVTSVLIFILIVLSSILPFRKFKKLDMAEMMREEE